MANNYEHDHEHDGNGHNIRSIAGDKVREISDAARSQASERVHALSEKARQQAGERVEVERERLATRVDAAASNLRQHAEAGDNLRYQAERRVAEGLGSAAGYLHSHQTGEVADDLASQVRAHPIRSIILAALIGYLLGKLLG
jgi:ElaB/YqjD/DUF883 family membrane-anchored ribosome-binding protein